MKFKRGTGNWTQYRKLQPAFEVDFHERGSVRGSYESYSERMEGVWKESLDALKTAQANGCKYVLFMHGSSTSRPGQTTSRSQVRTLMRSKEATPYVIRNQCVQHNSVFVAVIRPRKT